MADFSGGYIAGQWDPLWEDWNCDWRQLALERIEPPSWMLGDLAREAGAKGILFPSTKERGGINLVIFNESLLGPEDVLRHHDPRGDLPVNQDGWRRNQ